MMTRIRGLLALIGMAGILIGLPTLLMAVNHLGAPRFGWTWQGLLQALSSPDDGTLALTVLKAAGWISWAILSLAITLEIIARIRHLPVPRLRGLTLPQSAARSMVAAAAALFVATSSLTAAAPSLAEQRPAEVATPAHAAPAPAAPGHAERPAQAHAAPGRHKAKARTWTVERGDTLSEIALETTGHAANYPKLFKASRATTQTDGRHLTDPDLILPGWKITIPQQIAQTPAEAPTAKTKRTGTKPGASAPALRPDASPANSQPGNTAQSTTTQPDTPQADTGTNTADTTRTPSWLLSGLAGAGALLAGGLWVTLRRRRKAQFRSRRPGRTIASPEPDLEPVEKTLHHQGAPTGDLVLAIDQVLRRLAATLTSSADISGLPPLVGLDVSQEAMTARFSQPAALQQPWTCLDGDDAQVWQFDRSTTMELIGPLEPDSPPPWPQMVCLGADQQGWRLVNLEAFGVISLTGDPIYAADLARYIGTELAVCPWARDVEIDCLDICSELASIDPSRLRYHADPEDIIATRVATAIHTADHLAAHGINLETARVTFAGDELWGSRIVIAGHHDAQHLDVLSELIRDQPGRTATAVVVVDDATGHRGISMRLSDDGHLHIPQLNLDLVVNGLTEDEARGCAALLAAGQTLEDHPIPDSHHPDPESWAALTNEAGAIRDELTLPRDAAASDDTSLLPGPDEEYVTQTANTESDLQFLAPFVPAEVRARVEAVDPNLDDDLEQWWAESCYRPRVYILGRIKVRVGAGGDPARAAARVAFYSELVAYLCTRPEGATTADVAAAFDITEARVRRDMTTVRAWLGTNATGALIVPEARRAPQAKGRGQGVYTVQGALCDADLFRRLRLRGEARGRHGLDDLRHALRLVNGAPFDGMRSKGGIWLAETRLDQHLLCAIVDVAHIVSTVALQSGDCEQAQAAAELASLTAPYEATPQLDLAAALSKGGRHAAAAEVARRVVTWRDDSGDPPPDPSQRTEQILRTHRWLIETSQAS